MQLSRSAQHFGAIAGLVGFCAGCQAPNFGVTFEGAPPFIGSGGIQDGGSSDSAPGMGMGADDAPADDGGGPMGGTSSADDPAGTGAETSAAAESGGAGSGGSAAFTKIGYEFTTMSYGGEFDPDHIVAVWVEQDGAFVRTLEVHADKRLEHLIAWRLSSGEDLVDAITSATILNAHGPLSGTWNLRDSGGATVPAGDYVLKVEVTADDSNSTSPPGPVLDVPFTVGADAFDVSPSGNAAIASVHVWSQ